MKGALIACAVVVVLAGGYLAAAHLSGGAFPVPGVGLGGDRGIVRKMTDNFWEDIKFKDFKRAASLHAPDVQASVDIPFVIQRLFLVKPEALDIMSYEIVLAEIDSLGLRARSKCRLKIKDLIKQEIKEQEVMLYFERKDMQSPWYLKLEDSLRNLEGAPGKKT